jgi:hypothetical protein
MKARLVARYRLAAVSGRPEELVRPSTSQGVSLGYGCKTIRVRLMQGREWVETHDFQIKDDWQDRLDAMCDEWFGPITPLLKPLPLSEAPAGPVRPIPKDPRRPIS